MSKDCSLYVIRPSHQVEFEKQKKRLDNVYEERRKHDTQYDEKRKSDKRQTVTRAKYRRKPKNDLGADRDLDWRTKDTSKKLGTKDINWRSKGKVPQTLEQMSVNRKSINPEPIQQESLNVQFNTTNYSGTGR